MVNRVKTELRGTAGGAFYINEFHHVLVPSDDSGPCYYAGTYHELLEFDYEGQIVSPEPPLDLTRGKPWPGPHAGIAYVLIAGLGTSATPRTTALAARSASCPMTPARPGPGG
jgi:hypothetical protein